MNNVFVYCEIDKTTVEDVSLELLTKGRKLANQLGVQLEAVCAGTGIKGKVESQVLPYGVDILHVFDHEGLYPYTSKPHTSILVKLFQQEKPQICLMGATVIGRDLGPRVSSSCKSGLTADCTALEIGDYEDKKNGKTYKNLLYQIRPAFGGNIVATIVNPDHRPQMATVRSGVMKSEKCFHNCFRRLRSRKRRRFQTSLRIRRRNPCRSRRKPCCRRRRLLPVRLADRPDRRNCSPQSVYRMRHFGCHTTRSRNERERNRNLYKHRPGRSYQLHSRLRYNRSRRGCHSKND